jgi:hypothetical protein
LNRGEGRDIIRIFAPYSIANSLIEVTPLSDAEETKIVESSEEGVGRVEESPKMPTPVATGNEKIAVLKHYFSDMDGIRGEGDALTRVDLAIRNMSDSTIATAVFQAEFYDGEGNIIDTVRHSETELRPETSRLIHITSGIPISESGTAESYAVRLVRMITTDVEKVHHLRYEIDTIETGEEEVRGVVKNVSDVKIDAAVAVTFFDGEKENLGVRVVVLKDMEPNTARQYTLRFRPQEGETVRGCSITAGEVVA